MFRFTQAYLDVIFLLVVGLWFLLWVCFCMGHFVWINRL